MTEERKQQVMDLVTGNEIHIEEYKKFTLEEAQFVYETYKDSTDEIEHTKSEFFKALRIDIIKEIPEYYALSLARFNVPFVACNEDTFDDEAYIFLEKKDAEAMIEIYKQQGVMLGGITYKKNEFLEYYVKLMNQGVNRIMVKENGSIIPIELPDLCKRISDDKQENKALTVNNPELSLTMAYFIIESQKPEGIRDNVKLGELQEEMVSHFTGGTYLLPLVKGTEDSEEKRVAFIQDQNENVFLPLFTDAAEITKSPQSAELNVIIAPAKNIKGLIGEKLTGIVINPYGAGVRFPSEVVRKAFEQD